MLQENGLIAIVIMERVSFVREIMNMSLQRRLLQLQLLVDFVQKDTLELVSTILRKQSEWISSCVSQFRYNRWCILTIIEFISCKNLYLFYFMDAIIVFLYDSFVLFYGRSDNIGNAGIYQLYSLSPVCNTYV